MSLGDVKAPTALFEGVTAGLHLEIKEARGIGGFGDQPGVRAGGECEWQAFNVGAGPAPTFTNVVRHSPLHIHNEPTLMPRGGPGSPRNWWE